MGEVRFMISEAAKQVKVESHVLRYWEEELELEIGRTEMGHRYYTKDDIQLFRCIKKLKDEGMLLKDLKPLIPELRSTRLKLQKSTTGKSSAQSSSTAPALKQPEKAVKKIEIKSHKVSAIENFRSDKADTKSDDTAPPEKTSKSEVAALTVTNTEIIPATQLEQVRSLIGDVLTEVVTSNNDVLKQDLSRSVTQNVMREMDLLFQSKERQAEEHFRKLDCLIRQQQASRRETARDTPIGKLRKLLT